MLQEHLKYVENLKGKHVAVGINTPDRNYRPFYFYGILIGFFDNSIVLQLKNGIKEFDLNVVNDIHKVPER